MSPLADTYLHTVKHSINGSLHAPQELCIPVGTARSWRRLPAAMLARKGLVIAKKSEVPSDAFERGRGWGDIRKTQTNESMIGLARLDNLQACVETVLRDNVPGDLIETGVWRGGACIFMKAILLARGDSERFVYVADSFQGLPAPRAKQDEHMVLHEDTTLAVSREQVAAAFRRYGCLDERVRFVEGWFSQSLPALQGHRWAVIRLDGDMYESTMDALENLYGDLSPGGFAIIDDYFAFDECKAAVQDYRARVGSTEDLVDIDGTGAFWRKV